MEERKESKKTNGKNLHRIGIKDMRKYARNMTKKL